MDYDRPYLLSVENPQDTAADVGKNSYSVLKARRAFEHAYKSISSALSRRQQYTAFLQKLAKAERSGNVSQGLKGNGFLLSDVHLRVGMPYNQPRYPQFLSWRAPTSLAMSSHTQRFPCSPSLLCLQQDQPGFNAEAQASWDRSNPRSILAAVIRQDSPLMHRHRMWEQQVQEVGDGDVRHLVGVLHRFTKNNHYIPDPLRPIDVGNRFDLPETRRLRRVCPELFRKPGVLANDDDVEVVDLVGAVSPPEVYVLDSSSDSDGEVVGGGGDDSPVRRLSFTIEGGGRSKVDASSPSERVSASTQSASTAEAAGHASTAAAAAAAVPSAATNGQDSGTGGAAEQTLGLAGHEEGPVPTHLFGVELRRPRLIQLIMSRKERNVNAIAQSEAANVYNYI